MKIYVKKDKFEPNEITVKPGTVVRWVADAGSSHHVAIEEINDPPSFYSDNFHHPHGWSHRFEEVGTYYYRNKHDKKVTGIIHVGFVQKITNAQRKRRRHQR